MSKDGYAKCFSEYLSKISLEDLTRSKPLWEVHVIKHSTTTVVFKVHHSVGDGYALMGVLLSCLERADDPSLPVTFPSLKSSKMEPESRNLFGRIPRFLSSIFSSATYFGWSLLKSTLVEDDKTPIRSGNRSVELQPAAMFNVKFPMNRIKEMKSKLEVTVNDVITGIISLGIRLYMQDVDHSSSTKNSTLLLILNTRNVQSYQAAKNMKEAKGEGTWGNKFSFMHVAIPKLNDAQSSDPLQFVRKVHHTMKKRNFLVYLLHGTLVQMKHRLKGAEGAAKHLHKTLRNSSCFITNMV
ncbi:O-acyltransferase WSD1-like [Neltuma alba]|uniref:O-acyltransferase WSD1-like n=1 Tax=Neltuma alba TaxID=207710 RepID=UPI0010A4A563|nr:O-acyltransferase WSD1-like [Prosopis alba]